MHLICHVTLYYHLIEGSCKFIKGSYWRYVTTLQFCDHNHCDSVDMFLICHVTSCEHIFKMLCEFTNGVTTSPILVVIGLVQVRRDI